MTIVTFQPFVIASFSAAAIALDTPTFVRTNEGAKLPLEASIENSLLDLKVEYGDGPRRALAGAKCKIENSSKQKKVLLT
jgi:hypothetical protein